MRAHFAGDVVAVDASANAATDAPAVNHDSNVDKIEQQEPLESRIDDFKRDSKNMEVLTEFIDDVLQKAEVEATKQQNAKNGKNSQQTKEKSRQSFTIPDLKNGKMVNRARGFVVRIFDAICNCANSAAAPAQRITKLRKRNANNKATSAEAYDKAENKSEKIKKQENGKESDDKKKTNEASREDDEQQNEPEKQNDKANDDQKQKE